MYMKAALALAAIREEVQMAHLTIQHPTSH
jgi:hypothetical protein